MRIVILGVMGAQSVAYGTSFGTTQEFALGTRAWGADQALSTTANVPNCQGEFLYVKSDAARVVGEPVLLTKDFVLASLPNTANTGAPVYFSATRFTAADQFGWIQLSGQCPVKVSAAVAAGDKLFISGAGTVSGAQANGKQILNAQVLIGSTGAFTKTLSTTTNGATGLKLTNLGGVYAGITPSGTGIAASTVNDVSVGDRVAILSAAMTANGVVTATFTHTGYGICQIGYPFVQGQVV